MRIVAALGGNARNRMTGTEVVADQLIVLGHVQGAGHVGLPGCPACHSR